jgi:4-aminobutyrate aminotransferase-like enzyme
VKTKTQKVLKLLRAYEAANMRWIAPDGSWPIVWARARGMNVWDAGGRKYLDLTAAFGVAAAGHSQPRVVAAGRKQMGKLLHAMGDVHPHAVKAELARELSRITFERWSGGRKTGKTMFVNSGFEAVEVALKTAMLATGRRQVLAFSGGYHGLGYGALNVTHRGFFREPFRSQLGQFGVFAPFPKTPGDLSPLTKWLTRLLRSKQFGAILVEPIQGRGGVNVPPPGFLRLLRKLCDRFGALLIADEIFTGFGRTGAWFACEPERIAPDLICLGKALTGGFPLSACVGRADCMDKAWPESSGEAIHTSTFQGHPVVEIRGRGLMAGVEIRPAGGRPAAALVTDAVKKMLQHGFILLPEGESGNVLSFSPPLIISRAQIDQAVAALRKVLR